MYIKRRCLNDIGYFDVTNFPVAYGEESDFCYRARKVGWRHVVAGDVFVTHLEGKSFSTRKARLMEEMLVKFVRLHPELARLDGGFRQQDPLRTLRLGLDLGRIKALLAGDHALEVHCLDESYGEHGKNRVYLEYSSDDRILRFAFSDTDAESFPNVGSFKLPDDIARFNHTMARLGVATLHIDELKCRQRLLHDVRSLPVEVGLSAAMT